MKIKKLNVQTRTKIIAVLGLIFSLFLSFVSFASITPEEFINETLRHKKRLIIVGVQFEKWSKGMFPDLTPEIIFKYLSIHDNPKLMSLERLQDYGYTQAETVYEVFARNHGRSFSNLMTKHKVIANSVKDELNRIEDLIKEEFFKLHPEYEIHKAYSQKERNTSIRSQLELLEHIVDITDTGLFRLDELGKKKTKKYDGANFLRSQNYSEEVIRLSMKIEDNMKELLKNIIPTKNSKAVHILSCSQIL